MRNLFILGVLLLTAAFVLPAIAAQPEMPAGDIVLQKTKKPVVFKHSTHKDIQCVECHHPVEGKEEFRACSTAGCHDNFGMTKADKDDRRSYYGIMHAKSGGKFESCLACHLRMAGDDPVKKKVLASCAGESKCHPKPKAP